MCEPFLNFVKDVESRPLDTLVVDDFDDADEKKSIIAIHNSEVFLVILWYFISVFECKF